ncbi:envelope stress response regulator transcription factor CpxR [secondary endosymbiont of Ctenarytaina eucalypti]|uniref:Response regulator with CheY-like receiver domain and winged-helix DNA-binding domain n=1 Tax=secondary endosymbiont of Ctenarytaina eucalypti TaxID=1199245 RepID=J3TX19_9ENTR|nr:envelope stress response regulator transcription factor CpxR [secondary endosymbiont of Ctenarytaina eucalypti]AFP84620.1 response regulator with CheY-like receiver domain and winged-helix DNA-binding domain [secondary endosymbiont of Ctenarytaina eucalypti]
MHTILVVDDDRELTVFLQKMLEIKGFNVYISRNREIALSQFNNSVDLLLLDIMPPQKNGMDALQELRQKHQTPVIMLTTYGNQLNHILGVELGADDYLLKPLNERELIAKIRAIRHRPHLTGHREASATRTPHLSVDSLRLSPGRQEACFDCTSLELTGTEFTLLYLLARQVGQVVSREYLSQEALGRRLTPFDRAIDMHVSNLRRKLPARKDGHDWFKTVRGRGYLMVSDI